MFSGRGGDSAPKACLGPCWSPPEDDTPGHGGQLVFRAFLPTVQAQLKLEDIPTGSPGGSQLPPPRPPPTPGEALAPGSHPPRLKGQKLNQLCSEADSQEAKTPQLQDQVLTLAPSSLIEVKLHFYTQSHKVLFHFFSPIK